MYNNINYILYYGYYELYLSARTTDISCTFIGYVDLFLFIEIVEVEVEEEEEGLAGETT